MKIIQTIKTIRAKDYAVYLREKLNALFQSHRQTDIAFDIKEIADTIMIEQPQLYDDFLFKLEFSENEIHVTKSEHYTDDVNVLTLEDLLNNLYLEYPGRENIRQIDERS
jgi:L-rhamnose mutarotase